jgi:hypothetical protein
MIMMMIPIFHLSSMREANVRLVALNNHCIISNLSELRVKDMAVLYCETNLEKTLFSVANNSDPRILFLEGTPEEIVIQVENLILSQNLDQYEALRVSVKGTLIQPKNYCCEIWTIIMGSMILFPIFALCTDCYKQKVWKIQEVKEEVYRGISRLLKMGSFSELYIYTEDNLLNAEKVEHLREGVRGKVKNLLLINKVRGFNVLGNNYDQATESFKTLLRDVVHAECRWDREVWSNIRFEKL